MREVKLGYVDLFHGSKKAKEGGNFPDYEGTIKTEKGSVYVKLWKHQNAKVTNGEILKGYIYKLEED